MNLRFDSQLATGYHSHSQQARILTESWVTSNMYCPICGNNTLMHFPNNRAAADFYCPSCQAEYELKSKNGRFSARVADGAYTTFLQRIEGGAGPDFMFMSYSIDAMCVLEMNYVPKFFFVPEIVEKRKPLSDQARRKGWVGCNILYDQIPEQGRIAIVKNGIAIDKASVLERVQIAYSIRIDNLETRGWLFDVLNCINLIKESEFSLNQVYSFETALKAKHPDNNNIRPKIRQQLQFLRDREIVEFLGDGRYRKRL